MRNGKRRMAARLAVTAAIMVAGVGAVSAHAANKLIVKDAAGTTDKFVVTDDGKVGIGTNNPTVSIHSKGTTTVTSQILSQFIGDSLAGGGGFLAYRNTAPTTNNGMPRLGDRLGYMLFGGYATNGTTPKSAAGLSAFADGNWTDDNFPAYFILETAAPAGTNPSFKTERIRITSSGNVGIGQKAPTQKLEVAGGVRLNTSLAKPACDANSRGTLWFKQGAVSAADTIEVCAKQADENYVWKSLF